MKLKLIEKREEVQGVETFIFEPMEPLTWKAGQYLHYVLHHRPTDDRGSDRWFTVASAPYERKVQITTHIATDKGSTFKKKLISLAIGKSIEISHLEGDFVVEDINREYVFLAGGIGVTPFHSILKQANHDNVKLKVNLIYANRDENIPFREEFTKYMEHNPDLTIHYLISPERIDENSIKKLVPNLEKPIFYVSGPEPMVDSISEMLKSIGIKEDHIKQDHFPGYPEF